MFANRTAALASFARTAAQMLALAWRMDARLTLAYYLTAVVAALAPLAAGLTLRILIDNVVVTGATAVTAPLVVVIVIATHFAIGAISAAVQWGLHHQYYDYVLRYRLQDWFGYHLCHHLTGLDVAHLETSRVQSLITKVRDTHQWRLPDYFRVLGAVTIALVGLVAAVIALIPYGIWIVPAVIAATVPRLIVRARFGELRWSMYGSGAPESRKLWYFGWLLTESAVLRELKVSGTAPALLRRYRDIQARLFALGKQPLDRFRRVGVIAPIFEGLIAFVIAWAVLPDVTAGAISVGAFAFFITMLQQLAGDAAEAGVTIGQLYEETLYVRYWNELMSLPRVIPIAERPVRFDTVRPPRIEFCGVSFTYPSGREALRDVSFAIEPGDSVALVGANGAGKSTVIKLLCRFYDVTAGRILVNNIDLRELDLDHWYAHLGTLFQDFVQYKLSVRDNVLLGDPARTDDGAVHAALDRSGAAEFVSGLPGGCDQILGNDFDDGEELSGGQWQKLAIARALYRNAPILIMDEPTSAIDAEAEAEIFANLETEYRDKTLILVSHRFSTVRNADRIVVIEDGAIVEQGSHADLVGRGGRYAAMFRTQAAGYRDEV